MVNRITCGAPSSGLWGLRLYKFLAGKKTGKKIPGVQRIDRQANYRRAKRPAGKFPAGCRDIPMSAYPSTTDDRECASWGDRRHFSFISNMSAFSPPPPSIFS